MSKDNLDLEKYALSLKKEKFELYLPRYQKEYLQQKAEEGGTSKAEIVRMAIGEHKRNHAG